MTEPASPPIPLDRLARRGFAAIGVAVAVNVVIVAAVRASELVEPFGALTVPPVVFLTVLGSVAAAAVYGAITRLWLRPDAIFLRVAVIALFLSFVPDIVVVSADPTATPGAVAVLMCLHVTTAMCCIWLLTDRYSPIDG